VFAHHATRSDAAKGRVDKLTYAFTGPWRITALLKGASYELEHCSTPNRKEKKHASDLSPYPLELIPFQQLDGSETRYRQLHKPITAHPFREAGINGFDPIKPFKVSTNFLTTDQLSQFHLLEENARANPDARIRPLTHVSVNRAYQAESVGSNSLVSILIAIRRSPNL
jgi:hypothetical protein